MSTRAASWLACSIQEKVEMPASVIAAMHRPKFPLGTLYTFRILAPSAVRARRLRAMEMKRDVLFVHGGGGGAHEADEKLAASLRDALGGGYDVRSPKMPDEASPEVAAWKGKIARELATMDGEAILVGHSVGAHVLLKYLSEEEVEKPVAGLFLVAAPYAGTGGWELEEDALPEDFASKLPEGLPVFLYHGRDDEEVPFGHLALYEAKLPRAAVREFDGRGHQFGDDLSEVAGDIREVAR